MGVLSVLKSVKSKTLIWTSFLLTSLIFLGTTETTASPDSVDSDHSASSNHRIDIEQLPFCDDSYVDKSQGTRRR